MYTVSLMHTQLINMTGCYITLAQLFDAKSLTDNQIHYNIDLYPNRQALIIIFPLSLEK